MDIKKEWEQILKYGAENEKNRSEVIKNAASIIVMLTETSGKRLSPEELKKLAGGLGASTCHAVLL